MSRVGFLGFGRFGAAMADLCRESGHSVRAFDPHTSVPPPLAAGSVRALAADADVIVLAVPANEVGTAAASVGPHLSAEQLVVDVASVKSEPVVALRAVLGRNVPWVGTHPLFGPSSLARGELPRRVIVCPTPEHPGGTAEAHRLYRSIGCVVLEQDPEEHDRAMAWTHALAFFVAKGMLDAGVQTDVPYAPPSFQAIARTIDTVRSDAGHLFATLHLDNPFAAETRRKLIAALTEIDASLDRASSAVTPGPALDIAEAGPPSPELMETRELIDEVDREICSLLARRAHLARRTARAKAELGRGVHDPSREASVLSSRRTWAGELGLDPDSVEEIFRAVVRFSRSLQLSPTPAEGPNDPEPIR